MFTVLIVDDHKHLVESLAKTIPWTEHGITGVLAAYSGEQALELVLERQVDIVLTDIRMPKMNGLELISKIREQNLEVECVLLTGYADFQYAKQAVELQAANYLLKPIRDEELLNVLRTLTGKLRRRREERSDAQRAAKEERKRIARDLHDILGYTLTNTLLNVETAKMLLESDKEEGLKRLERSSELLRSGMLQMRSAVRTMEQGDGAVDVRELLSAFFAETQRLTEATVLSSFDISDGRLDSSLARVMFHAVQEGITNGIRHGSAARFVFRLRQEQEEYELTLWNDGKPYDEETEGMGLRAMRERVERWGGTIGLSATGQPPGTLLSVIVRGSERI